MTTDSELAFFDWEAEFPADMEPFMLYVDVARPEFSRVFHVGATLPKLVGIRVTPELIAKIRRRGNLCESEGLLEVVASLDPEVDKAVGTDAWELVVDIEYFVDVRCIETRGNLIAVANLGEPQDISAALLERRDSDPAKWKKSARRSTGYCWVGRSPLFSQRSLGRFVKHVLANQPEVAAELAELRMADCIAGVVGSAAVPKTERRRGMGV